MASQARAESILCSDVGQALAGYPHAKKMGNIIYLSGLSARQPDDSVVGGEESPSGCVVCNIAKQTEGVIQNMEKVLKAAGGSLQNLVEITVFLTSMSDYSDYNRVYNQYFDAKTGPARTTVAVKELPGKNLLIEMKGIAVL